MRLDLKRDSIVIVPESEQDRAYLEDTFGIKDENSEIRFKKISDVALGFQKPESFVLKGEPNKNDLPRI